MKLSLCLPCVILLVGTSACHTTDKASRATAPDDALLLDVSSSERSNLAAARKACDQANDAYSASQADYDKAGQARTLAGQARDAAIAKLGRAEVAQANAAASGTTAEVETARQDLLDAKAEKELHDAKVVLCDKQTAHASTLATLAKKHVAVAEANVELTKVRAVNTLDRPELQKPDVSKFETALRLAEADENVARTRSEAAEREVEIAADLVKERESTVERP